MALDPNLWSASLPIYSERDLARQELEDEHNAQYGDPRRCPHHPHVTTSSPDGMFDAPCGECESEMHELHCEEMEREEAQARLRGEGSDV